MRLNSARKAVEKAAETEAYKARLAEINARSAAAKAELLPQSDTATVGEGAAPQAQVAAGARQLLRGDELVTINGEGDL